MVIWLFFYFISIDFIYYYSNNFSTDLSSLCRLASQQTVRKDSILTSHRLRQIQPRWSYWWNLPSSKWGRPLTISHDVEVPTAM